MSDEEPDWKNFAKAVLADWPTIREAALREAANAIWNGPIKSYGRVAQGSELNAAHACRETILSLIRETK
jgi:hypothetical protein